MVVKLYFHLFLTMRDCLGTDLISEPQEEQVNGCTLSQKVRGQPEQDHKKSTGSLFSENHFDDILLIHLLNDMGIII